MIPSECTATANDLASVNLRAATAASAPVVGQKTS
jgi:hypothetical protein